MVYPLGQPTEADNEYLRTEMIILRDAALLHESWRTVIAVLSSINATPVTGWRFLCTLDMGDS
jgi:hypothetical protein